MWAAVGTSNCHFADFLLCGPELQSFHCVCVAAFSLFGSSEEDQRDEMERKQDEMMLLLKKAKVTGSAPATLCDHCRADTFVCLSSVCTGVSCRLHLASSIRLSYWLIRLRTTRPSSTPTARQTCLFTSYYC